MDPSMIIVPHLGVVGFYEFAQIVESGAGMGSGLGF